MTFLKNLALFFVLYLPAVESGDACARTAGIIPNSILAMVGWNPIMMAE